MNDTQPSWLLEDCPPWCVAEHEASDHPHDRSHQSAIVTIPVVLREQILRGGRLTNLERGADFDIARFRPIGTPMEWVFVGDDEHRLELSVESAARLVAALAAVSA